LLHHLTWSLISCSRPSMFPDARVSPSCSRWSRQSLSTYRSWTVLYVMYFDLQFTSWIWFFLCKKSDSLSIIVNSRRSCASSKCCFDPLCFDFLLLGIGIFKWSWSSQNSPVRTSYGISWIPVTIINIAERSIGQHYYGSLISLITLGLTCVILNDYAPHAWINHHTALIFVYIMYFSIFYPFTHSEIVFYFRKDVFPYDVCVRELFFFQYFGILGKVILLLLLSAQSSELWIF
jgi:hypothetical protein